MLVLSRKIGQEIILPESGVTITVLGVHGKRVRLGIEAPANSPVHRQEVWRRILDLTQSDHGDVAAEELSFECSSR